MGRRLFTLVVALTLLVPGYLRAEEQKESEKPVDIARTLSFLYDQSRTILETTQYLQREYPAGEFLLYGILEPQQVRRAQQQQDQQQYYNQNQFYQAEPYYNQNQFYQPRATSRNSQELSEPSDFIEPESEFRYRDQLRSLMEIPAPFRQGTKPVDIDKWPMGLQMATEELLRAYHRQSGQRKWFATVHNHYWRTLSSVYLHIEALRRTYLYGNASHNLMAEYRVKLIEDLQRMHKQMQLFFSVMGLIRSHSSFAFLNPVFHRGQPIHFEAVYGSFYHMTKENPLDWKSNTPLDMNAYFSAFFTDNVPRATQESNKSQPQEGAGSGEQKFDKDTHEIIVMLQNQYQWALDEGEEAKAKKLLNHINQYLKGGPFLGPWIEEDTEEETGEDSQPAPPPSTDDEETDDAETSEDEEDDTIA